VPILNFSALQIKGLIYFVVIILFLVIVVAYVFLSAYKYKIAKIDFLNSNKIVSWNIEIEEKSSKTEYITSLIAGICLGVVLAVNGVFIVYNILLSLALAFIILGWWSVGKKRLQSKRNETDNFILSHMGLIYGDSVDVFDGYSKGILSVIREDNVLKISILKRKKQEEIIINIPDDKIADVDTFLKDLKEHFNNNEE
jgi:hypothetical protein